MGQTKVLPAPHLVGVRRSDCHCCEKDLAPSRLDIGYCWRTLHDDVFLPGVYLRWSCAVVSLILLYTQDSLYERALSHVNGFLNEARSACVPRLTVITRLD